MSSQISTEEDRGFHEPPGDEFVVDTQRFQTRLLKQLICEHMEEESMVTGAQFVFTQKLQQISSNHLFYSYTVIDYGSEFVPRIQEVSWTCENISCKTSLDKMDKYGFSSVQFSCSVVSYSLRPHESQHARPPCPSPTPRFTQTHVHRVSDAIQPSHPLSSPFPPAPNPSQHQSLFQ